MFDFREISGLQGDTHSWCITWYIIITIPCFYLKLSICLTSLPRLHFENSKTK